MTVKAGNVELTGQEVSKGRTNNTDNNNTDFSDTDYVLMGLFATNLGEAWRISQIIDAVNEVGALAQAFPITLWGAEGIVCLKELLARI